MVKLCCSIVYFAYLLFCSNVIVQVFGRVSMMLLKVCTTDRKRFVIVAKSFDDFVEKGNCYHFALIDH